MTHKGTVPQSGVLLNQLNVAITFIYRYLADHGDFITESSGSIIRATIFSMLALRAAGHYTAAAKLQVCHLAHTGNPESQPSKYRHKTEEQGQCLIGLNGQEFTEASCIC